MKLLTTNLSLLSLTLLTACSGNQITAGTSTTQIRSPAQTYVYHCADNKSFVARIEAEKAWVFLPTKTLSLPQIPAASGSKFSDGSATFWNKGKTAIFENTAQIYKNCTNNRAQAIWEHAKLNGVDYRAVGNEPGWSLEITHDQTTIFTSHYGQDRYEFETSKPLIDTASHTSEYQLKNNAHTLSITLSAKPCADTMSDRSFSSTVSIRLDNKKFTGCGQALH